MRNKEKIFNDLHKGYQRTLEVSFIGALLLLCILFFSFQKNQNSYELPYINLKDTPIEIIPPTKQPPERKPKPPTPTVVVADDEENEMLPDELITDMFRIDKTAELSPPETDDSEIYKYWAVSIKPELKHMAIPYYPELARKAGIEGRVMVTVTISKTGRVIDAVITSGITMLNDAALEAARKCTFIPAKQRDKYVKVKMVIPFDFHLK